MDIESVDDVMLGRLVKAFWRLAKEIASQTHNVTVLGDRQDDWMATCPLERTPRAKAKRRIRVQAARGS